MDYGELYKLESFCHKYSFERGIYSSVVNLSEAMGKAMSSLPFPMMKLVSGQTKIPIANKYHTPHTLGSDRLAAAVGAYMKHKGCDVLVVDVGTCITYDFVNSNGEYLGGNISPGPTARLRALHDSTALLPMVERKGNTPDLGYDTETAIRSGVMRGVQFEIEGYIRDIILKYPAVFIYLTGGVHLNLHISEKKCIFADNFIVPFGLNKILLYNEELKSR